MSTNEEQSLHEHPGRVLSIDPQGTLLEDGNPLEEQEASGEEASTVDLADEVPLDRLRQIVSSGDQSPSEAITNLLQMGAERFGVENAHLTEIDPVEGTHTIVESSGAHPQIEEGDTTDLSGTYCRKLLAGRDALAVKNAPKQGWEGDPAYEAYGLASYVGAKVVVDEELYGTICFVDSEPREERIGETYEALLEFLARAIGREVRRGRRETRIQRSEARLGALFAESPDMVTVHDMEGTLLDANPRMLRKTGYDREELLGKKVWDLEQGRSPEKARGRWEEMTEEMVPNERRAFETRCHRKDGTTFPVEVHLRRLQREGEDRFMTITHDITDRLKRERRLERLNDLFRKAEEMVDIGAWEYDVEAGELFHTDRANEIYGLPTEEDLTVDRTIGVFHPEDRPQIREVFSRAIEDGNSYDEQLRIVTPEGEKRWVRALGEAHIEEGEVVRVYGTIQDISGRKRREEVLREAKEEAEEKEELFRSVMDNAPVMIDIIGQDGQIETINEHFEEVLGWSKEEIKGAYEDQLWEALYPDPDRRREVIDAVQEAPDEWIDFRPRTKNGRRVDSTWTNVELSDGRRLGLGLDISDRKRRERNLKKTNATLEAILNQLPMGVLTEDASRQILAANERLGEIFELPMEPAELESRDWAKVSRRLADRFAKPEEFSRRIEEIMHRDDPVFGEELRMADGRVLERDFVPYQIPEGTAGLWVYQDITEQKEREEALREAKEEAEEASRLKSAMLANMNHEIRTPLTSVTGFADIMRGELKGRMKEFAEQIHKSGERLMRTLDSVLQLSKLEAGISDIDREEVDLARLTRETVELLRPRAEEQDVALDTKLPGGPVTGMWNEGALNRIAENLIENAIKFTPGGGTVTVRVREEEQQAVLKIEDTGVGISEEALPEIFEAFQQESEGLGREFEGSGLGLSIVQRLVDVHKGTVEVESEKGTGSRFTVCLPLSPPVEKS